MYRLGIGVLAALSMGGCANNPALVADATALACGLSAAAAAAQGVATTSLGAKGKKKLVDAKGRKIIGIGVTAGAAACTSIGGILTGTTPPAAAPVVTPVAPAG